ncbi:hypothetical protein Zmor_012787 [Zophobas morio]|uniref:Uncharacterized protein n=1 Tax=Zophobas morio TaxID=2755281 RepID=A0AA38MEN6_9CUCU|nr:hypothetical protein Zmor_012787 [Zophobas morio]
MRRKSPRKRNARRKRRGMRRESCKCKENALLGGGVTYDGTFEKFRAAVAQIRPYTANPKMVKISAYFGWEVSPRTRHAGTGTQTEINKMSIFDTSLMFEQFRTTIGKSRVGCRRPPLFNYK